MTLVLELATMTVSGMTGGEGEKLKIVAEEEGGGGAGAEIEAGEEKGERA